MPLVKTKACLASLKLAKVACPDPVGLAQRLSVEGTKAALQAGDFTHPFVGIQLWAMAYGQNRDVGQAVAKACSAFDELKHFFKNWPSPEELERRLNDPARSEKGYSLDALSNGSFSMPDSSYGLDGARETLLAMLNPPKPAKDTRKPLDTHDAWLLPTGKLVHVGYTGHIAYEQEVLGHGVKPESVGWIKITNGRVWIFGEKEPTQRQLDKLFDWCEFNGKDFETIRKKAKNDCLTVFFETT